MPDDNKRHKAFLELITQHKGIIYKAAKIYADDIENQQDLQQEIIYQLWKSYEKFSGNSSFSTWMYRVAVNTGISYLRSSSKHSNNNSYTESLPDIADDSSKHKEEKLQFLYDAIHTLPAVEKTIIFFFLEGLSHKEIAINLGITEVNARVRLNRCKEKLKIIINNNGYEF